MKSPLLMARFSSTLAAMEPIRDRLIGLSRQSQVRL
jgi:hypothetical protein